MQPSTNPSVLQTFSHFPGLPVPRGLATVTAPPDPCPYLPGRLSVSRGFRCDDMPAWAYQELMDAGFRRSGTVFYQMACPSCRSCRSIRVPVGEFLPGRGQRRVRRRNRDLHLAFGRPELTHEKHRLFGRYLASRHEGEMSDDREALEDFLYRSPTDTLEMCYRDPQGALLGVGICDVTPAALSSVYFYFDPLEGKRSLGTYSMLMEIETAGALGLPWYYPGYWVQGCRKMEYKARLRPSEYLGTDGQWRPLGATVGRDAA